MEQLEENQRPWLALLAPKSAMREGQSKVYQWKTSQPHRKTREENQRITSELNFLAPQDILKISSRIGEKPSNPSGELWRKTNSWLDWKVDW